jgi:LysM repeat protein
VSRVWLCQLRVTGLVMQARDGMLVRPLTDSPEGDGLPDARLVRGVMALIALGVLVGVVLLAWSPTLPNERQRTSAAPAATPANRATGQTGAAGSGSRGAGAVQSGPASGPAPGASVQPPDGSASAPGAATPVGRRHTIRPGDTLLAIANEYATTPDALRAANPGLNETALQIGAEIAIPSSR